MEIEVIVALAAAASALLVSVITGIAQILQIRAKHRLDKVRQYQQQLDEAERAHVQEIRGALREGCKALQRVQDEILLLMKSAPDSVVSKTQHERLLRARNQLLEVYREYHPVLGSEDRKNLDEARKKVVNIILGLELEGLWSNKFLSPDPAALRELERANMVLAHYHRQLLFSALGTATAVAWPKGI